MYFPSDEEPMPYHSRKGNGKWCRHKVGRKHELEVKKSNWGGGLPCQWTSYDISDGRAKTWFSCKHQASCRKCGKIIEWTLKDKTKCPEYIDLKNSRLFKLRSMFQADLDNIPPDL